MSRDRKHPLETLGDRLFPGNRHPSDFVRLGLDHRSRHSNNEGVVNRSYDIPILNQDGSPYFLRNTDINNIHRVLESLTYSQEAYRATTRDLKYNLHTHFFGSPYRIFTETFYDSVFAYDGQGEATWNGEWNPPLSVPPVDPSATLLINGGLLHNVYSGSVTYNPLEATENDAGTYRTINLAEATTPYTPTYYYKNSWSPIGTIGESKYFKIMTYSSSTAQTIENTAVYIVILVHANAEFWSKYWTGTLNEAQALECGNRFTVYYKNTSGSDPDTDYNLLYLPHVPVDHTFAANTNLVSGKIFGKLVNVLDPTPKANSDVTLATQTLGWYDIETDSGLGDDVLTPQWASAVIKSDFAPSGIVNNTAVIADEPDIFSVDISLTPGAEIYSWSIQLVRRLQYNMRFAGMDKTLA